MNVSVEQVIASWLMMTRQELKMQADAATIATLQGELRDTKAELAVMAEAKPVRNGRAKTTAPAS